jgi:hypothetical protein
VKDVIHYFLFRAVSPVTGDGMWCMRKYTSRCPDALY